MSINSIMGTGLSALMANQQALAATSSNVANVNTEGYSRKDVHFVTRQSGGGVSGVDIDIQRVANAYLAAAEMRGAGDVSAAEILSRYIDRAQGLFGDPSERGSVFATIDPVMQSFGALSVDPSSSLRRSSALSELQTMLSQLDTTQNEISELRTEAHRQGYSLMEEANALMSNIAKLNGSIQRARIAGVSSAESETEQSRLLDRLAEIVDIRTAGRALGGVEVRTGDGLLLVDVEAARFGYSSTNSGSAYPGIVIMQPNSTTETPMASHMRGGELLGLMRARDQELVNLGLAFGEFAAGVVDAINDAHNAGSAVPAPTSLVGRNTGLLAGDALRFTGASNLGIVDADGQITRNYRIDFGAGTVTDDLGGVTAFANSIGDFQTALNTRLAANGDGAAAFANGSLSISAAGGRGVVVADDPTSPASRLGRGFAQTFGLNDLITKSKPTNYATGLQGGDAHGFGAGTLRLAVRDSNGGVIRQATVNVTAGGSVTDLLNAINTQLSGYGSASIDANGRVRLAPVAGSVSRIDVLEDTTQRGATNVSFSDFFGVGEVAPAQRSENLQIKNTILANPNLISTAKADLAGAAVGTRVLSPGDGRGALALEAAGTALVQFQDAGGVVGQAASIIDYAARLSGHAALRAEALESAAVAAESVREEVRQRRLGEEGVNLDEELVKMTTYQQTYAAASRMISAARDLYDIVLNMV